MSKSRIWTGFDPNAWIWVDFAGKALDAVGPLAARKAIELVPLVDNIPQIIGDRKQLETMLSRVLRDAMESVDPNTSLQFRLFQSNDEAFIRVDELDSGLPSKGKQMSVAGIKERNYSGHDLALAVVVQLHGGRVMTAVRR